MAIETRKLVKARPKALEYLPEWAKCCPEIMEYIGDLGDIVLDLSTRSPLYDATCKFCGAIQGDSFETVLDYGSGRSLYRCPLKRHVMAMYQSGYWHAKN